MFGNRYAGGVQWVRGGRVEVSWVQGDSCVRGGYVWGNGGAQKLRP